jgi:hypothetical protein
MALVRDKPGRPARNKIGSSWGPFKQEVRVELMIHDCLLNFRHSQNPIQGDRVHGHTPCSCTAHPGLWLSVTVSEHQATSARHAGPISGTITQPVALYGATVRTTEVGRCRAPPPACRARESCCPIGSVVDPHPKTKT